MERLGGVVVKEDVGLCYLLTSSSKSRELIFKMMNKNIRTVLFHAAQIDVKNTEQRVQNLSSRCLKESLRVLEKPCEHGDVQTGLVFRRGRALWLECDDARFKVSLNKQQPPDEQRLKEYTHLLAFLLSRMMKLMSKKQNRPSKQQLVHPKSSHT